MFKNLLLFIFMTIGMRTYAQSCTGTAVLNVTLIAIDSTSIEHDGNVLSVDASWLSYQWYVNGVASTNDTLSSIDISGFNPGDSLYVTGTLGTSSCNGASNVFVVLNTSISSIENDGFYIYPNPVENTLYFSSKLEGKTEFYILSMDGKLVYSNINKNYDKTSIDLVGLPKGIYIFQYKNKEKSGQIKFVKK